MRKARQVMRSSLFLTRYSYVSMKKNYKTCQNIMHCSRWAAGSAPWPVALHWSQRVLQRRRLDEYLALLCSKHVWSVWSHWSFFFWKLVIALIYERQHPHRHQQQAVCQTFALVGKLSFIVNPTDQGHHYSPSMIVISSNNQSQR